MAKGFRGKSSTQSYSTINPKNSGLICLTGIICLTGNNL